MIDSVFQVVKTIVNKELRGVPTPGELNLMARNAQERIFRGYFEDAMRDQVRSNRGMSSRNYADLIRMQHQRIEIFAEETTISYSPGAGKNTGFYTLPDDLYFIKPNGVTKVSDSEVIDEVQFSDTYFKQKSLASASSVFPSYKLQGNVLFVYPSTFNSQIRLEYLRVPKVPRWTYTIVSGTEIFNQSATDYQDFELHPSEFSNLVITMCSYLGIMIREQDVVSYAENLRNKQDNKEER